MTPREGPHSLTEWGHLSNVDLGESGSEGTTTGDPPSIRNPRAFRVWLDKESQRERPRLLPQRWSEAVGLFCGSVTRSELRVPLMLATFADKDGHAYPSLRRLAAASRMRRERARQILRALDADGWLDVEWAEHGAGRGHRHQYQLLLPSPVDD